jgi:O-antigen/teichoic acid export membrane protein
MIAWAHVLQPRELGALTIVVAAQEIIFSGAFMWWSHSVLRFLPRYEISDKRHAFLNTEVAVVAFCGLVQVVLVLVFMEVYFGGEVAGSVKLAAAVSIFFRSTSLYFSERARSTQAILNYTILQAVVPAAGLAISLVLAEKIPATVETMLYALALPQALGLLWVAFRSDFMSSVGRPDREIVREALSFGIPVSLGALIGALALNSPRFIVDQMLGLEAAGAFGVSYGLGLRASNIAVMLVTAAAYPLVVRKMETEGWDAALRQLSSNTILVALIVCPAALGLLAVNGSVIKLIMPESMQHYAGLSAISGRIQRIRSSSSVGDPTSF